LEMVAIPPRILFSIMRYAWGFVMRSDFASVCFNAMAQAREGRVTKCKQSNLSCARGPPEMLKDICKEEDVGFEIVVVIVFERFAPKARPRLLCPLIVLLL